MLLVIVLLASLPPALLVLGGHKAVGMLLKLAANFRVSRQVSIETRMRCPKLRVVYQLWILRELLSYFRMLIKVAVLLKFATAPAPPRVCPGALPCHPDPHRPLAVHHDAIESRPLLSS